MLPDGADSREWTRERIEQFLREEGLGYQKVSLPFGLSTPGETREATLDLAFGAELGGRSVLDIGSYLGYFCLAAKERGAGEVVGWEVDAERMRLARTLAEIKGLDVRYEATDLEKWDGDERFDVVLCLNVMHHLADPIAALDKLLALTRERLVLELAAVGPHDRKKLGMSAFAARRMARSPVIVVGRGDTSGQSRDQKFFFTRGALRNLLENQRNAFARVETVDSGFKGRFIVVAEKRRVGHLVVVAGPTSAGKSTLLDQMLEGRHPALAKRMGVDSFEGWDLVSATGLRRDDRPRVERMLFHYDTLRPFGRSAKTHERDEALDVLRAAERLSVVSIYTPPERLRRQLRESELSGAEIKPRHLKVQKLYERDDSIATLYERWIDHVDSLAERLPGVFDEHLVVTDDGAGGELHVTTSSEWRRETRHPGDQPSAETLAANAAKEE